MLSVAVLTWIPASAYSPASQAHQKDVITELNSVNDKNLALRNTNAKKVYSEYDSYFLKNEPQINPKTSNKSKNINRNEKPNKTEKVIAVIRNVSEITGVEMIRSIQGARLDFRGQRVTARDSKGRHLRSKRL